ncbi:hypothetical protein B0H13DRAFT_1867345 [Mycena leptocephala]|nr:hypothetical protein B0H13DRAFT_1867345 [Mycena leptocephala]
MALRYKRIQNGTPGLPAQDDESRCQINKKCFYHVTQGVAKAKLLDHDQTTTTQNLVVVTPDTRTTTSRQSVEYSSQFYRVTIHQRKQHGSYRLVTDPKWRRKNPYKRPEEFKYRPQIHKFYVSKPVKPVEMKEIFKNLVENTVKTDISGPRTLDQLPPVGSDGPELRFSPPLDVTGDLVDACFFLPSPMSLHVLLRPACKYATQCNTSRLHYVLQVVRASPVCLAIACIVNPRFLRAAKICGIKLQTEDSLLQDLAFLVQDTAQFFWVD